MKDKGDANWQANQEFIEKFIESSKTQLPVAGPDSWYAIFSNWQDLTNGRLQKESWSGGANCISTFEVIRKTKYDELVSRVSELTAENSKPASNVIVGWMKCQPPNDDYTMFVNEQPEGGFKWEFLDFEPEDKENYRKIYITLTRKSQCIAELENKPKSPSKTEILEVIRKWKFHWYFNEGADYKERAYDIDSNMQHHLAEMLSKAFGDGTK